MSKGGRKTDKYRLLEKRGTGTFEEYKPWLKVHEFGSRGTVCRLVGWKANRIYEFMSCLEKYYFVLMQWDDRVIDIREQYPLLPLQETLLIADKLGYEHPIKTSENKTVITTDFLITLKEEEKIKYLARAIKTKEDCRKQRIIEKLSIEKEFWDTNKIDWGVVTENQISRIKAINILNIYNDYFWKVEKGYSNEEVTQLISLYISILENFNSDIVATSKEFEKKLIWDKGEGLNFFRYLLATKILKTDMNKRFNFNTMKVWM